MPTGRNADHLFGPNAERAECRRAECRPQPGGMPTRAECRPGAMPNTTVARYIRLHVVCPSSVCPSETKTIKNLGKSSRGRTQVLSKIFRTPAYRVIFSVV